MVYNFIDTSAILNGALEELNDCIISSISLMELENIKSKREKTEDIRADARRAIRFLINDNDVQTAQLPSKKIKKICKEYDLVPETNDFLILATAELLGKEKNRKIFFYTSDGAQYTFAGRLPHVRPIIYKKREYDDEYYGWRECYPTDEQLASLYAHPENNILDLEVNEYAKIIVNDKVADIEIWTGQAYRSLKYKDIKNNYIDETIRPRNSEQKMAFDLLQNKDIRVKLLMSAWGSGKTMLAVNYALEQVAKGNYKKLVFIRNNIIVADTNDIGFLPGDINQKMLIWGGPIADHLGGQEMLENLIEEGVIEIYPLSHIRGRSIKNSIILCDECENLNDKLVTLLLSRVEDSSEIIFCGDVAQIDNEKFKKNNGIKSMLQHLKGNSLFGVVKLIKSERGEVAKLCDLMIPPK